MKHHHQQQIVDDELYYLIVQQQQQLEEERRLDQQDSELYSQLKADERELKDKEAIVRKNRREYQRLITRYVQSISKQEVRHNRV